MNSNGQILLLLVGHRADDSGIGADLAKRYAGGFLRNPLFGVRKEFSSSRVTLERRGWET